MRIWLANFRYGTTERELRDALGEHAPIAHVDFAIEPVTGRSRGFAWITVADEDGPAAIKKWNGFVVGGRTLRAEVATSGGRRYARARGLHDGGGVTPPA